MFGDAYAKRTRGTLQAETWARRQIHRSLCRRSVTPLCKPGEVIRQSKVLSTLSPGLIVQVPHAGSARFEQYLPDVCYRHRPYSRVRAETRASDNGPQGENKCRRKRGRLQE